MSCVCSGSTHDSVAFEVSELGRQLRAGKMRSGFWLAGDPAYLCTDGLLTPWPKAKQKSPHKLFCGSFNFFHCSHGIHVKQAFGVLVKLWGILWRHIEYSIVDTLPFLSAAMSLHNFTVKEDGIKQGYLTRDAHEKELRDLAFDR